MEYHYRKKEREEFKQFNSSDINAIVKSIDAGAGWDYLQIEGAGKFTFGSITSELNNHKAFNYTAEPGDSIVKPSFSDTLTLIKQDGKKYRYTFRKYHIAD